MQGLPNQALPPLRQDLRLSRGSTMLSGERAWIIQDPVRQKYFQIGRRAFELLSDWRTGHVKTLDDKSDEHPKGAYSEDEIATMEQFLSQNELLDSTGSGVAQQFIERNQAMKKSGISKLIQNYLFFRVPLVRPDRFLRATYPYIAPLFTKSFLFFSLLAGLFGLYLVSRQWDQFTTTFMHFFSFQGLILFAVTLTLVKTIHELAHGYMAVRFGVRVPIMGVAFLLMFPMLYTDVSDAWKLRSRREKVLIDGAGILAEIVLATFATLLWVFLPDGGARSAAFFVATTSWTLSLLVNLNPLMRFDGYFLLADSLNVTNLQARSTGLGKWLLREILFGLHLEPSENLSRRHAIGLALYAWAVWIYRFFLFLGIALFVYHATFKVLGILLFLAEVIWLIGLPIYAEIKAWWNMRNMIMKNPRSLTLPLLLIAGVIFLAMPIDKQVSVPAVLQAKNQVNLFAPFPSRIEKITVKAGQLVEKGDVIFTLSDNRKEFELRQANLRLEMIDQRLSRISSNEQDRANSLVLAKEKAKERQTIEGLEKQVASLTIRAEFTGRVADLDKSLQVGMWVPETSALATLVSDKSARVRGLVAEADLERVQDGAKGLFVPDDPLQEAIDVRVTEIATVADAYVDEAALASIYDGPIAVSKDEDERLKPTSAHYGVMFSTPDEVNAPQILRGHVLVEAKPKNYLGDIFRNVLRVLIRESNA